MVKPVKKARQNVNKLINVSKTLEPGKAVVYNISRSELICIRLPFDRGDRIFYGFLCITPRFVSISVIKFFYEKRQIIFDFNEIFFFYVFGRVQERTEFAGSHSRRRRFDHIRVVRQTKALLLCEKTSEFAVRNLI